MNHHHGLDRMAPVGAQPPLEFRGRCASPPVSWNVIDVKAQPFADLPPSIRKLAGLENDHPIARGERIDEGRLARSRPGRGIYDDVTFGLKNIAQAAQDLQAEFGEFGSPVIDHRLIHCPQDAVRNVGRSRNLKKMTACVNHFILDQSNLLAFISHRPPHHSMGAWFTA